MNVARFKSSFSFNATFSGLSTSGVIGVGVTVTRSGPSGVEVETVVVDSVVLAVVDTEEVGASVVDVDSLAGLGSVESDTSGGSVTNSEVDEEPTVVVVVVVELTVVEVSNVVDDVVELVELDSVVLGSLKLSGNVVVDELEVLVEVVVVTDVEELEEASEIVVDVEEVEDSVDELVGILDTVDVELLEDEDAGVVVVEEVVEVNSSEVETVTVVVVVEVDVAISKVGSSKTSLNTSSVRLRDSWSRPRRGDSLCIILT